MKIPILFLFFIFSDLSFCNSQNTFLRAFKNISSDLKSKLDRGFFRLEEVSPLSVISIISQHDIADPATADTLIGSLMSYLPSLQIEVCHNCLSQTVHHSDQVIKIEFSQKDTDAISSLIQRSPQIRSGIWVNIRDDVVSYKVASLRDHRVIASGVLIADTPLKVRSYAHYTKADHLERMAKGQGLFHSYIDTAFYPSFHLSFNMLEQWGDLAQYQSGLGISLSQPFLGFGPVFYHSLYHMNHMMIGVKLLISLPTALARGITKETNELFDPLLNVLGVIRLPVVSSSGKFSLFGFLSSKGSVGLGVSF